MDGIVPTKAGIVLALLFGGVHAIWLGLVAIGFAQRLIDFVFWMHFIKPVLVIESFDLTRALILLAVTSTVGFVIGYVLALLWNRVHGSRA